MITENLSQFSLIPVIDSYIQNSYLKFLIILAITVISLKLLTVIFEKVLLKLAKKNNTKIDDELVERSSKPLTIIIFLLGLRIALEELTLTLFLEEILSKTIYSFIIIVIGYLFYVTIDLVVLAAWKKFASKTKTKLDDNLESLTHNLIRVTWIVFVTLYILELWGVEIGPLLAGLGIAGLAVALALQPTLGNVFSGISMILDKTLRKGDLVYLDNETKGKIVNIGFRSTKISTFDNELIIVPNSKLAESKIQNVALPEPKSRVVVPFGVAYGSDIDKVKKIILKEIRSVKNIEKDPEPMVRFIEMGASSLNFKTYFYVNTFENRFNAIDESNTKIYNALNKNKISIPFPQLDVHIKNRYNKFS